MIHFNLCFLEEGMYADLDIQNWKQLDETIIQNLVQALLSSSKSSSNQWLVALESFEISKFLMWFCVQCAQTR